MARAFDTDPGTTVMVRPAAVRTALAKLTLSPAAGALMLIWFPVATSVALASVMVTGPLATVAVCPVAVRTALVSAMILERRIVGRLLPIVPW